MEGKRNIIFFMMATIYVLVERESIKFQFTACCGNIV